MDFEWAKGQIVTAHLDPLIFEVRGYLDLLIGSQKKADSILIPDAYASTWDIQVTTPSYIT